MLGSLPEGKDGTRVGTYTETHSRREAANAQCKMQTSKSDRRVATQEMDSEMQHGRETGIYKGVRKGNEARRRNMEYEKQNGTIRKRQIPSDRQERS